MARQRQLQEARVYAQAVAKEQADWETTHVKVQGGWVTKEDYDAMTPEQQRQVVALGVDEYNRVNKANYLRQQAEFERDNVKVGEDYLPRIAFEAMKPEDRQHLQAVGLATYQKEVEAQQQAQASVVPKLSKYSAPDGGYYTSQALAENAVTTDELVAAGFLRQSEVEQAKQDAAKIALQQQITNKLSAGNYAAPEGGYYIAQAVADKVVTADQLVASGYITEDEQAQVQSDAERAARIDAALPKIESYKGTDGSYDLVGIFKDLPISPGDAVLLFGAQPGDDPGVRQEKHLAVEQAIETASVLRKAEIKKEYASPAYKRAQAAASIARVYLDLTVPFYGTHRHWQEMSEGGRLFGFGPHVSGKVLQGVSLGTDFLMVVPVLGELGAGAREVTKAAEGLQAARYARVGGALKKSVGLGLKLEKPVGMTEEAFQALKAQSLLSRMKGLPATQKAGLVGRQISATHLSTGELWKQVAWPATLLESGGKVVGKAAQLGKRSVYGTEIEGRLVGDVFDPETGNILKAAEGGINEDVGGKIGRRVRVFVVKNGKVLLGSDRTEPKGYYHLPGGHIPDPDMTNARYRTWLGKKKPAAGISLEDAARIQMESEFGLKLKNVNRLPNYLGRINQHSLNGMYMFKADAASAVDLLKYAKSGEVPEIKAMKWWNGKSVIEVGPATKELLAAYNEVNHMGWDMSKVLIHGETPKSLLLLNSLDPTWVDRLAVGEITRTSAPAEFASAAIKGTATGSAKESGAYGQAMLGRIKAMYGSLENVIDWNKIPESVVSDAAHTIKIRVSDLQDPRTALAARAKLVKALGKSGDSLIIESGDSLIVWRRSRLMRELGGGLTHATPFGDEFVAGTIVKFKPGMPLKEQGLFWSPEPLYAFTERAAHGAMSDRPTIYIATKEWIENNTDTLDKIYRHQVEAEAISPVGTEIPKPKQVLHTRLGRTGQRVDIMLQEPLTNAQRVKLKALGLVEQVQSLYSPVVYLEGKAGKPLTTAQMEGVAEVLEMRDVQAARVFRTVAHDPGGALRVLQSLSEPDVYEMRVRGTPEGQKITVARVKQEAGESPRAKLQRVDRAVERVNAAYAARLAGRTTETVRQPATQRAVEAGRAPVVARTPSVYRVAGQPRTPSTPRHPGTPRNPSVPRTPSVPRSPSTPRSPALARVPSVPRVPSQPRVPTVPRDTTVPRWLPPDLTPKQRRKVLDGSVAFAMGELSGKTAYWILYPPKYGIDAGPGAGEGKAFSLDRPEGITIAPDLRSAYKTIEARGGKVPARITGQIGFAPYNISSGGQKIKFEKAKKTGGAQSQPRLSRSSGDIAF